MAFQSYAFQLGAFQYNTGGSTPVVPMQGTGWGFPKHKKQSHEEFLKAKNAVEQLPHKIKHAIKRISKENIKREEREDALLLEIQHIDAAFQLVYLGYLELLHADWVERELARLFAERKMALQIRQNEEIIILLMLGII